MFSSLKDTRCVEKTTPFHQHPPKSMTQYKPEAGIHAGDITVLPCLLHKIMFHQTRWQFSSLASLGESVPAVAWDSCSGKTSVESHVLFYSCSPSATRFSMVSFLRCFFFVLVAHHWCKEWLFELPQSSSQLKPVRSLSVNLSHQKGVSRASAHYSLFFFV